MHSSGQAMEDFVSCSEATGCSEAPSGSHIGYGVRWGI
jgi:hypothetical protein